MGRHGYIAYCAWQSIEALAGQQTDASIAIMIKFLSRGTGLVTGISLIFSLSAVGYGLAERRQRRRTIASMQSHIRELENIIDPGRSTSGLTRHGDTNPLDL